MEPWTDGVPLMLKAEVLFIPKLRRMQPWTNGVPLMFNAEVLQTLNSPAGALD